MYPCGKQIVMLTVSSVKLVLLLYFSLLHIFQDDDKLLKTGGTLLKTEVSQGYTKEAATVRGASASLLEPKTLVLFIK